MPPYLVAAFAAPLARWPVADQGGFAGMVPPPPAERAPAIQEARELPSPPLAVPGLASLNNPRAHASAAPHATGLVPVSLATAPDIQSGTKSHEVDLELGSADMPTVGSAGHCLGTCKPCAFYRSKGCQNGVNCSFCHLCEAGEKRRRQKELNHRLRAR
jgi:hypothetical protein